ncbi:hypothetical protein A9310_04445 [Gordonia sp. UCD-TK1]|nr:hypothetical protein A9310_04445 [Gordonia sp. UCD-TK1]
MACRDCQFGDEFLRREEDLQTSRGPLEKKWRSNSLVQGDRLLTRARASILMRQALRLLVVLCC